MPGKHKPDKQRADGGTRGSCHARYSRGCRSLLLTDDCHDVGLPGRNVHLTNTESYKENENCQSEIGHQRYKNEENVGGEMRGNHSVDESPTRGEPGSQQSGTPRKDICPKA